MSDASAHYSRDYFAWQKHVGAFGGWANEPKFTPFIEAGDRVLDFGCGGGYLLHRLCCGYRLGIDVNPDARRQAASLGLRVVATPAEVADQWADAIISNHALEHVEAPLAVLRQLRDKLRPGGRIVLYVPCESVRHRWAPDDRDRHLYTWTPMCLGNLLTVAGFEVRRCERYRHTWPPGYRAIARLGGRPLFNLCCRLYGLLSRRRSQVRVIAIRPATDS